MRKPKITNYTIAISKKEENWERQNIIYSPKDALSFQKKGTINECGVRLHKDLLILFENDKQAKNHDQIEFATDKTTFNRQHDIKNLILSENDAQRYMHSKEQQERIAIYRECSTLSTLLQIIAKEEDTYNQIHDLNGNEIITHT